MQSGGAGLIPFKDELENFPPVNLKLLEEKGEVLPEDTRKSIELYNKALENLRMNSEDIAIIELKKAISINPHFHEAVNLLGLCYSGVKEYDKAAEMFKKVIAAEKNSVKALEYMKYLEGVAGSSAKHTSKASSMHSKLVAGTRPSNQLLEQAKPQQPVPGRKPVVKKDVNKDYIKVGAGFIAGALLIFLIQLPFHREAAVIPASNGTADITPTATPANEFEGKYNQLNEEYQKMKTALQQVNDELGYYRGTAKLAEAERLAAARSYEEAGDLIALLRSIQFKSPEKERFDKLLNETLPRATWAVHLEGSQLYYNQNYKEAASKLAKVLNYGGNWDYIPEAYFLLGNSYAKLNDIAKAQECFKKLKELYPNSSYARQVN